MTDGFYFVVTGTAAPKGSAKAFQHYTTGDIIVHADNRDALKAWEHTVRVEALRIPNRRKLVGPVRLTADFALRRPRSVSVRARPYPLVKPDLSKLVRGIEDALTGVLYLDDAQICAIATTKTYAAPDAPVCVRIAVAPLLVDPVKGGR